MKKHLTGALYLLPLLLTGCSTGYKKTATLTIVYAITAGIAFLILLGYLFAFKKKDPWYILLFSSVLVVNTGYFILAASQSLQIALLANAIAYLGSVFLPIAMWMILLRVGNFSYRRWFPILLLCIGIAMFGLASSPGYSTVYYQEVSFALVNGMGILKKVYGPLHILYLFYLLGIFGAIVVSLIYGIVKEKIQSAAYGSILTIAVFVNLAVWMTEQFVDITFEILSISYIISELFLLGLHLMIEEQAKKEPAVLTPDTPAPTTCEPTEEQLACFTQGILELTPTERLVFQSYISGKTTKEIMEYLNITENTLKFHNKNIYSKLGVSSRKQLIYINKFLR